TDVPGDKGGIRIGDEQVERVVARSGVAPHAVGGGGGRRLAQDVEAEGAARTPRRIGRLVGAPVEDAGSQAVRIDGQPRATGHFVEATNDPRGVGDTARWTRRAREVLVTVGGDHQGQVGGRLKVDG